MPQVLLALASLLPFFIGVIGAPTNGSITTEYLIKNYGYPVETHTVTTNDGYVLTMQRIPYSPRSPQRKPKKTVLFMHGFLCSSTVWVIPDPTHGLAYLLSDAGYDVWLANARGTKYSLNHLTLNSQTDAKYWDFSFHEIGKYDLPAMVVYILDKTASQKITYIGHSQGATTFLVLNSLRPQYNRYFETVHLLAPVAHLDHTTSPFFQFSAKLYGNPQNTLPLYILGKNQFIPDKEVLQVVSALACDKNKPNGILCSNPVFMATVFNNNTVDPNIIDLVVEVGSAGVSTKLFLNYLQEILSGRFCEYDYGPNENFKKYRSIEPPEYPIYKIDAPIYLYNGKSDACVTETDFDRLESQLDSVRESYIVPDPTFDHMSHLYNARAKELVYDRIMENMQAYN